MLEKFSGGGEHRLERGQSFDFFTHNFTHILTDLKDPQYVVTFIEEGRMEHLADQYTGKSQLSRLSIHDDFTHA